MGVQSSPIVELIREGRSLLERHEVPNALRNAEWMLSDLIGCDRADLYLRTGAAIEPELAERFQQRIRRRCRREPLQYILESVEFMSYRFAITRGVFIPRFETELLVERVEQHLIARGIDRDGAILDLCSGSGVIAVSLLLRNPGLRAHGIDRNADAVALAGRNAEAHGVIQRAHFERGDAAAFLAGSTATFDLIVSNPPYIPSTEIAQLAPEVREYEPLESLAAGPDGLDFYREAVPLVPPRLTERGVAAMEIGAGQGEAVSALMRGAGLTDVVVYQDYSGFDRVAVAYSPK